LVGDSTSGKAQPLDSLVLTPTSWKRMGDLNVGDIIVDPDGGTAKVTGIFPQGFLPVYRMTFSDRSVVEASGDHLWLTQDCNDTRRKKWQIRTTDNICKWKRTLWFPTTQKIDFSRKKLLVAPYLLGVLLGNGHFGKRSVRVSSTDDFTLRKLELFLPLGVSIAHRKKGDYEFIFKKGHRNPLLDAVRSLGLGGFLAHHKFIPDDYKFSSVEQRMELLQGLMDTDGTATNFNGVVYSTSSFQLASDVRFLVESLGGVVSWRERIPHFTYKGERKEGKRHYQLSIAIEDRRGIFTLPRKQNRVHHNGKSRRSLVSIELVGRKDCQCVSVDSKRHLYITDDLVVTHNTWLSQTLFAEACQNPAYKDYELIFDDVEGGALMDIEHYFGKAAAKRIRPPRTRKGLPVYSETVEDFYYTINDYIKLGKPFIYVLDSQDGLESKAAIKKFEKQRKAAEDEEDSKGSYGTEKAKYHSEHIRQVIAGLRRTKSILLIIGQTRDNLGFSFDPKTRSGGKALRFYANLEIWTSVGGKILKNVRGKERTVGTKCLAQVKKNRVTGKTGKDRQVQIPIYHDYGIDDIGSCVDYLISEKHWQKIKRDDGSEVKKKIYDAEDIFFEGSRGEIIAYIEKKNLEDKVRKLTGKVWEEIENECLPNRKRRYE